MALEVSIAKFIRELQQQQHEVPGSIEDTFVFQHMQELVSLYVKERLESCSDIRYNDELAKALIADEDFTDLLNGKHHEYVIRKHIRNIMKMYLTEVRRARLIGVTDRTQFSLALETVGFNMAAIDQHGSSGLCPLADKIRPRSIAPDGNVLAVVMMLVAIVGLFALMNKQR
jgi:hypothetical protein